MVQNFFFIFQSKNNEKNRKYAKTKLKKKWLFYKINVNYYNGKFYFIFLLFCLIYVKIIYIYFLFLAIIHKMKTAQKKKYKLCERVYVCVCLLVVKNFNICIHIFFFA